MKNIIIVSLLLILALTLNKTLTQQQTLSSHTIAIWNSRLLVPLNETEPATALLHRFFRGEGISNVTTFEQDSALRTLQLVIWDGTHSTFTKKAVLLIKYTWAQPQIQNSNMATAVSYKNVDITIIEQEVDNDSSSQVRTFTKRHEQSIGPYVLKYFSQQRIQLKSEQMELKIVMKKAPIKKFFQEIQNGHFIITLLGGLTSFLLLFSTVIILGDKRISSFFSFAVIIAALNFEKLTVLLDIFEYEKYLGYQIRISFILALIVLIQVVLIFFNSDVKQSDKRIVWSKLCVLLLLCYQINLWTIMIYTIFHVYWLYISGKDSQTFEFKIVLVVLPFIQLFCFHNLAESTPDDLCSYLFEEVKFVKITYSPLVILLIGFNAFLSLDFATESIRQIIGTIKVRLGDMEEKEKMLRQKKEMREIQLKEQEETKDKQFREKEEKRLRELRENEEKRLRELRKLRQIREDIKKEETREILRKEQEERRDKQFRQKEEKREKQLREREAMIEKQRKNMEEREKQLREREAMIEEQRKDKEAREKQLREKEGEEKHPIQSRQLRPPAKETNEEIACLLEISSD